METGNLILGVVVSSIMVDNPTYEVIQNGQVYDEVRRLDTALNIMSVLLAQRIEVERG